MLIFFNKGHLRIEDTFSIKMMEIEASMQIWWCHSSTFEDTPYKVYIFLKLRAFCNHFQQRKTKQTYVVMLDHCELRAWGTLSQVGVPRYIEIHLLHRTTYVQYLLIKWQYKNCTKVQFSVGFGLKASSILNFGSMCVI